MECKTIENRQTAFSEAVVAPASKPGRVHNDARMHFSGGHLSADVNHIVYIVTQQSDKPYAPASRHTVLEGQTRAAEARFQLS